MSGSDAARTGNDVAGMLKQKGPDRQEVRGRKHQKLFFYFPSAVRRLTYLLFDLL